MIWLLSGVLVLALIGGLIYLARRDAQSDLEKSIVADLERKLAEALEVQNEVDSLSDDAVAERLRRFRRGSQDNSVSSTPPPTDAGR